MDKQNLFLCIVQTVAINNAINLSIEENAKAVRDVFSASGTLILMDDAIWASSRIPENMSAFEAADEFLTFSLKNLRQAEEQATGESMKVPGWFAR
jgi:hypothetical protein